MCYISEEEKERERERLQDGATTQALCSPASYTDLPHSDSEDQSYSLPPTTLLSLAQCPRAQL